MPCERKMIGWGYIHYSSPFVCFLFMLHARLASLGPVSRAHRNDICADRFSSNSSEKLQKFTACFLFVEQSEFTFSCHQGRFLYKQIKTNVVLLTAAPIICSNTLTLANFTAGWLLSIRQRAEKRCKASVLTYYLRRQACSVVENCNYSLSLKVHN